MTDEEKRLAACARAKAWRLANPERDKATHAAHAAKNPAREARRKADWAASNKTHVAAQMAAHYAANKDKIVARSKKWVTDNAARAPRRIKRHGESAFHCDVVNKHLRAAQACQKPHRRGRIGFLCVKRSDWRDNARLCLDSSGTWTTSSR